MTCPPAGQLEQNLRVDSRPARGKARPTFQRALTGTGVLLSGVLWLLLFGVGVAMHRLRLDFDPPVAESPIPWMFFGLTVVTMVVFMGAVAGLHGLPGHRPIARLGLKAFIVGAGLAALMAVVALVDVAWWSRLLPPALAVAFLGWMTFAIANLKPSIFSRWAPGVLPRWNAVPVLIGLVPVIFIELAAFSLGSWVFPTGVVVFGLAWLLLGYAVWPGGDAATEGMAR